jgi:CheY-like chemotaxis protein
MTNSKKLTRETSFGCSSPRSGKWLDPTVRRSNNRHSVLLVINDDTLRCLYGFSLAAAGFRVSAVRNGLEALVTLQEHRPDVIITELDMPVVNGITLIRIIESRAEFVDIPVIAMTALGHLYQWLAKAARADLAAGKPAEPYSIRDLVIKALPQYQVC